jgi:hypothetical protein
MPDSLLAVIGIKKFSVLIAGAVGGLISLQHYGTLTIRGKTAVIISSVFLANYTTYPLLKYFEADESYELGIAVCVGIFGLNIISAANRMLKDTELWQAILDRFVGGAK